MNRAMRVPTPKRLLLPAIAFAVAFGTGLFLVSLDQSLSTKESVLARQQLATSIGSDIERRLSQSIASTYMLELQLIRSGGESDDFESFAQSILDHLGGIGNLQLAPDGVVRRIHPLTGNEAAIGHDILRDDRRRDEAVAAVASRELTLAGPFTLIQGGVAVIARNPVFLPLEGGDGGVDERFWGFVSALIPLDNLIDAEWLDALEKKGYRYRLQRLDPAEGGIVVFGGDPELDAASAASVDIVVPNGVWTLSIGSDGAKAGGRLVVELCIVLLLSLGLAAYCRRIIEEPIELRRRVAEQTHDLQKLAYRDELTGLPNRNRFLLDLSAALGRVEDEGSIALMLLDLDHFKNVNDILGHDVGDRLLVEATRRLLDCLPPCARLSRLGGDEFTVVLETPGALGEAERVSRRIIEVIARPFYLDGREAHVSASIGIAGAGNGPGADSVEVTELLKRADQAMYQAKSDGRGDFCVFDESMQEEAAERVQMIADLRLALQGDDEFELLYQPIVCAATGRVCKAEALIRWNHPEKGTISPLTFIPLAERNGLIHRLGEWVFAHAAEQAARWRHEFASELQVSVNVSPAQLRIGDLVPAWRAIVERHGLPSSALLVEITESVLLGDSERGKERLRALRRAGFEVALDDFGTGYSSLSYLKELRVDYLKIDKSFVQRLQADSDDLVLCRAIIAIARQFDLKVVAEGVETEEQRRLLNAEGCDYLQGYLYSRPVDARTFEERHLGSPGRRAA